MESVEDHGCIVDIGINGSKAFLPMKEIKGEQNNLGGMRKYYRSHFIPSWKIGLTDQNILAIYDLLYVFVSAELKVGQYLTPKVEEVKNEGRMVRLSAIAQACAETEQGWNLTNLLPGLLVKATVKKV